MATEKSVFDAESLTEEVSVAGHKLRVGPLKFKVFRKAIEVISDTLVELSSVKPDDKVLAVVQKFLAKHNEFMAVVFPKENYPFMTEEFIEENFSIPLAKHIIERIVDINKMDEMFPFLKNFKSGARPSASPTQPGA